VHPFLAQGLNEDPFSDGIEAPADGRFDTPLIFQCCIADSEGWRSAFRTDVDHDSEVMPISVPN
jgi:hypothetical protein